MGSQLPTDRSPPAPQERSTGDAATSADAVTVLLSRAREGDEDAAEQVFDLVYDELRKAAGIAMRGQPDSHTLQPTALVHEAYLKLTGGARAEWNDRRHFLSSAARAMRSILVDHARARLALKRGGGTLHLTLRQDLVSAPEAEDQVLAVHEALDRLHAVDPRKARVVELRFFGGLSVEDAARVMETSPRTVKRLWQASRAWLYREIAS